jgi:hypothetical protein
MSKINKTIMTLAGLLLIVAAALKFHEMIATCVPSWQDNPTGFWESYEFFLIQIPLEFALGVWMVCGLFRKGAWIAGTHCWPGLNPAAVLDRSPWTPKLPCSRWTFRSFCY